MEARLTLANRDVHLTGPAYRDLAAIVKWSTREFSDRAAHRYEAKEPRHILLYRHQPDNIIEIARILHVSVTSSVICRHPTDANSVRPGD